MYYIDDNIYNLHRVFDQNDRSAYLRLDLNENPGGLPEDLVRTVLDGIDAKMLSQYPETRKFTSLLANYLGADSEQVCLVNGSAEGIRYIIQCFTSKGGRIVGVVPSYFMFQVYSEMYEREFIKVPYKEDLSMDVADIISELTDETQLLILLNPNNPMGNVYTGEELEHILSEAKKREITVLIDEAYYYFHPDTFVQYALGGEHVFVTRTFSKLFSMAGARLGYVVGWSEGIKAIRNMCTPHNVNMFGLKLAEAVITRPAIIKQLQSDFFEGRKYLIKKLEQLGYEYYGEAGNFIFIKPHTEATELVRRMREEKKILIKSYDGVGRLGTVLRVTIGECEYMQQFVDALSELDV